jgi:hypothetical protein
MSDPVSNRILIVSPWMSIRIRQNNADPDSQIIVYTTSFECAGAGAW